MAPSASFRVPTVLAATTALLLLSGCSVVRDAFAPAQRQPEDPATAEASDASAGAAPGGTRGPGTAGPDSDGTITFTGSGGSEDDEEESRSGSWSGTGGGEAGTASLPDPLEGSERNRTDAIMDAGEAMAWSGDGEGPVSLEFPIDRDWVETELADDASSRASAFDHHNGCQLFEFASDTSEIDTSYASEWHATGIWAGVADEDSLEQAADYEIDSEIGWALQDENDEVVDVMRSYGTATFSGVPYLYEGRARVVQDRGWSFTAYLLCPQAYEAGFPEMVESTLDSVVVGEG
ncbi:hypothetical protein [Brevibacterium samyangense]|uniref:Uncharacterized protein n=1 Tax=Brevibacterium samyangense TaxID=366888 RepID=A0ABP5F1E7_9MICO